MSNSSNQPEANESIEALRREIDRLNRRVAALEGSADAQGPTAAPTPSSLVDAELLAVISAALAAYLGVKPSIRQVRLASGASWAQQGRVIIQASHALAVRHDEE